MAWLVAMAGGRIPEAWVRSAACLASALLVGCRAPDPAGAAADTSTATSATTSATTSGSDGDVPTTSCAPPCTTGADTDAPPAELDCADNLDDDSDGALDCFDADCWQVDVCTERFIRVATFNVLGIGTPGSDEHDKLLAVLSRIDADIVCMQEVGDDESASLDALRDAAGYAYFASAPAGRPSGGMIRAACLSRYPIAQYDAIDEAELSTDPQAPTSPAPFYPRGSSFRTSIAT